MWGNRNPRTLLVGMSNGSAAVETVWRSLKHLNIESLYDPAVPLPGRCPHELKTYIQTQICTQMLTAAPLTINKKWKQPKCPSTDEWINKNVVHPDNGILFGSKKEQSTDSCYTWIINLGNLQPDTRGCILYDFIDVKCPEERHP